MTAISRREFFKQATMDAAVAGFLAAAVAELDANPLGLPIGSQTYPHRALLKQDFPGLLKLLADLGVQRIEFPPLQMQGVSQLKVSESMMWRECWIDASNADDGIRECCPAFADHVTRALPPVRHH